jgi:hypothetical protein
MKHSFIIVTFLTTVSAHASPVQCIEHVDRIETYSQSMSAVIGDSGKSIVIGEILGSDRELSKSALQLAQFAMQGRLKFCENKSGAKGNEDSLSSVYYSVEKK